MCFEVDKMPMWVETGCGITERGILDLDVGGSDGLVSRRVWREQTWLMPSSGSSVCVCAQGCVCLIGAKKETGQIIARGLRGKHSVTGWRRTLYFLCMCVCTWLCVWTHSCILVLTMCMTVHSMFAKFLKNMDFIINLHKNNNWKCNLSIFSLLYLLLVYINKDAGVHCFPV